MCSSHWVCPLESDVLRRQPAQAEQRYQSDDYLRNDAVKTPDLQNVLFDEGEAQGKAESDQSGEKEQRTLTSQGKAGQRQVASDAD